MKGLYVQEFKIVLNFEKAKGKKNSERKTKLKRSKQKEATRGEEVQFAHKKAEEPMNQQKCYSYANINDSVIRQNQPCTDRKNTIQLENPLNLNNLRLPEHYLNPSRAANNFQEAENAQKFWKSPITAPSGEIKGFFHSYFHEENSNRNSLNSFRNRKQNINNRRRINWQKNIYFEAKTNKKHSPIDLNLITAKNGWKEHSLRMLNHSDTNLRLNPAESQCQK